jgi:hypothetical protein
MKGGLRNHLALCVFFPIFFFFCGIHVVPKERRQLVLPIILNMCENMTGVIGDDYAQGIGVSVCV